ncbi:protein tincar [Caerostris extrusa]|uniref:Protein tincar n=1 Tax=Caerostris extrusa TaxID=172846 RepID=A0AAV4TNV6_CAEEX|nr:protein tincar [Caerostris extrusa]
MDLKVLVRKLHFLSLIMVKPIRFEKEIQEKAILNVVHSSIVSIPKISPTEDDDIYWLKPKPPPPKDERTSTWHKSQEKVSWTKT